MNRNQASVKNSQAEESLRQFQKELAKITRLNTVEGMAAGLAHELNQLLTALPSISPCP